MVWDAVLCPGMLSYGLGRCPISWDAVLYLGTLSYGLSQSNLPKKGLKKKLSDGLGRCPLSWDAVLCPVHREPKLRLDGFEMNLGNDYQSN